MNDPALKPGVSIRNIFIKMIQMFPFHGANHARARWSHLSNLKSAIELIQGDGVKGVITFTQLIVTVQEAGKSNDRSEEDIVIRIRDILLNAGDEVSKVWYDAVASLDTIEKMNPKLEFLEKMAPAIPQSLIKKEVKMRALPSQIRDGFNRDTIPTSRNRPETSLTDQALRDLLRKRSKTQRDLERIYSIQGQRECAFCIQQIRAGVAPSPIFHTIPKNLCPLDPNSPAETRGNYFHNVINRQCKASGAVNPFQREYDEWKRTSKPESIWKDPTSQQRGGLSQRPDPQHDGTEASTARSDHTQANMVGSRNMMCVVSEGSDAQPIRQVTVEIKDEDARDVLSAVITRDQREREKEIFQYEEAVREYRHHKQHAEARLARYRLELMISEDN